MVYIFMHNSKFFVYRIERLLQSRGVDDILVIKDEKKDGAAFGNDKERRSCFMLIASMSCQQHEALSDVFVSIQKSLGQKEDSKLSCSVSADCMGEFLESFILREAGRK